MSFNSLRTTLLASLLATAAFLPQQAQAQRRSGDVGIGLQLGQPSGLSLAVYRPNSIGLDILAAWDLDDFFYVNPHGIFTTRLGDGDRFHLFFGPGAYVGIFERPQASEAIRLGLSATGGLSVMFDILEIYARITPRLPLFDETNTHIGGGVGIRLYL